MKKKIMVKRVLEIILGIVLVFSLILTHNNDKESSELLIWQILTPSRLKMIVWVLLFFVAARLIFGKYKDYSSYFFNLINHYFGDRKNVQKKT